VPDKASSWKAEIFLIAAAAIEVNNGQSQQTNAATDHAMAPSAIGQNKLLRRMAAAASDCSRGESALSRVAKAQEVFARCYTSNCSRVGMAAAEVADKRGTSAK